MRAYARTLGQDEELWGLAGLLHDLDYERFPEEHPLMAIATLRGYDASDELLQAIAAHSPERSGVMPESLLDKYLYACDELSGFICAVANVRPNKSIHEVEVSSVMKKFNSAAFAAGVNRQDVCVGVAMIEKELEDHIQFMIDALRADADRLGLAGS